mgnify:CR=1 FL=1
MAPPIDKKIEKQLEDLYYDQKFMFGRDKLYKVAKEKDIDINLFEATNVLLYNYKSIDDCLRYYEAEKVLLPLMVHQN